MFYQARFAALDRLVVFFAADVARLVVFLAPVDFRDAVERDDVALLLLLDVAPVRRPPVPPDFVPVFAEPVFAAPVFPLPLLPDEAVFALDLDVCLPRDPAVDLELRPVTDLPSERLPVVPFVDGAIVFAAAPTAPIAAPVAAPVRISPATSSAFSTIAVDVDLLDRDEVGRLRPVLPRFDLLAIKLAS